MARLLRIHFASIGHADARLAPLTLDLRAHGAAGSGVDSVLWLRNGGGKSTILNLFYSLFRPERRDFLGASAEGRARHLEDYVKADDLAFVVTEWDVDPTPDPQLFATTPPRRRIVGQVLAWRDRQKSSDPSRLRRRFFSLRADESLGFEDLPIEGLGAAPVRSFEAFRDWLDELRQARPALEAFTEDGARRWAEHLDRLGLDPELFGYQLRMNAREGSADEAFRFRTTDEFVEFFLEIAFDATEADQVSANVEGFRDKLARRPGLLAEQAFLIDARHHLQPLQQAVAQVRAAERDHAAGREEAAAVGRALRHREAARTREQAAAAAAAGQARAAANQAGNDAARLGRWASGLERRALELELQEAEVARRHAEDALAAAEERRHVATAAVARDERHALEARRDAKAEALRFATAAQEPLRREVARAGATLRARLAEAAVDREAAALHHDELLRQATAARDGRTRAREEGIRERATLAARVAAIDAWLAERDRDREALRAAGLVADREEAAHAAARWRGASEAASGEADRQARAAQDAARRAEAAATEVTALAAALATLAAAIDQQQRHLRAACDERSRLQALDVVREVEAVEAAELDAPGLVERLGAVAEALHRRVLRAVVDGAEDDRAWQALERTGLLPPSPDAERVLATLKDSRVTAWPGAEYLVNNLADATAREAMVRGDPAAWHGIVVADEPALERAAALLATTSLRTAVTVTVAGLRAAAAATRVVLPGHPAHWDPRAGGELRDHLGDKRRLRDREEAALRARERDATEAAAAVARWRGQWGDGRLALAESEQDQRLASRARQQARRAEAHQQAGAARDDEAAAAAARASASARATADERRAERVQAYVDRYEVAVDAQRAQRDHAVARGAALEAALEDHEAEVARHEQAMLAARDAAAQARRDHDALLGERDRVELTDDAPPAASDLVQARAAWSALHGRWLHELSENRLQWELDQLDSALRERRAEERAAARGRERAVDELALGTGAAARVAAEANERDAQARAAEARSAEKHARAAVADEGLRRRDAADLPSDEPPPTTARQARDRKERCGVERDAAQRRYAELNDECARSVARQQKAEAEASLCGQLHKRIHDVLGEATDGEAARLPDDGAELDAIVGRHVAALRVSADVLGAARGAVAHHGEALREVALAAAHEAHRSRVKERLKAPAHELGEAADTLGADLDDRLAVVRATLDEIDHDRRLVLQQLDKVAMDGVRLLAAAERASRLPDGLGAWEGEPFLRIRVDVSGGQAEREARLEPLLDRWIAKGVVPAGRKLVDAAARELAGRRLDATLLKPDALLRRERHPVTEMQTFSRGQQLTVAILLYCTLVRLRAEQRGRAGRVDAGVLLLDNPVGTCSSVPLLELQRRVARQMRVQLVYTTGVNDPDAVATFPNTVRLRNAHRGRATGDLHVTVAEEGGVEAIRVVATP